MRGTPIKRMIMNLGNRMIYKTTAFKFLLNYFFLEEIFLIIFGLRLRPDGAGNSNATTTTKTTLRVLSVVGESHKIISLLPRNLLALCILLWLELIFRHLGPGGVRGGRAPLELRFYRVKIFKVGKISFLYYTSSPSTY